MARVIEHAPIVRVDPSWRIRVGCACGWRHPYAIGHRADTNGVYHAHLILARRDEQIARLRAKDVT